METFTGNLEQWYEFGATECEPIGGGGVCTILWNPSGAYKVGTESQLFQIPIKQETVEVCERYDVNPYQLYSEDCVLLVTNDGGHLVGALEEKGVPVMVIGQVNPEAKREILHERPGTVSPDEMEREGQGCLDRPTRDELYEVVPDRLLYKR